MVVTVEISMYPFKEDYKESIKDFIAKLNRFRWAELEIATHDTSTQIVGDYERVMEVLSELMAWSHEKHGRAAFVTKFIPGYKPGESKAADA